MTAVGRSLVAFAAFAALLPLSPSPTSAQAERPPRVPRIDQIGEWRAHDPEAPESGNEPWTPGDVARFLARFSQAVFRAEARSSYPIGNTFHLAKGEQVRQLRAEAASLGVDLDGRVCVGLRPEVFHVMRQGTNHCDPVRGGGGCDLEGAMDGRFGEKENVVKASGRATSGSETSLADDDARWWPGRWQHRLVVLRPGTPSEESRRVVASDRNRIVVDRAWTEPPGAMDAYEIRGSFDPRWFQMVPREVHTDTVRRLWTNLRNVCDGPDGRCVPPAEPLDPMDPRNQRGWAPVMDREATLALATPTHVPAVYGFVRNGGKRHGFLEDPYFQVSSVVMRLDDADYRHWKVRYLLYKLQEHGFQPGDSPCVLMSYKPGWHTYYDDSAGPSDEICAVEGSHMWTGPSHVCRRDRPRRISPGGPFHPTQFGPGDFEKGISAFLLETIAALEANGYRSPRILTIERPAYQGGFWSTLSPELRSHPALAGELDDSLEPPLSLIGRRPPPRETASPAPGAPPSASPPATGAPSPPTGAPTPPPTTSPSAGAGGESPRSTSQPRSGSSKPTIGGDRVRSSGGGGGGTVEPPGR